MSAAGAPEAAGAEPDDAAAFAKATGAAGEVMAELVRYRDLLGSWNDRMNLVGPTAMAAFWLRHALDSAQLLRIEPQARVWLDIGAGGGFPGVVLAILLKGSPGARVHLVESVAKRSRFLAEAVAALELPAVVHTARAETLPRQVGVQVVTARACAPMPRLLGYAFPHLKPGVSGLFLKGRGVDAELTEARGSWRFQADLLPSLSDPSGRVVRIERLARV